MDEGGRAAPASPDKGHGRSTVLGIAWLSLGRGVKLLVNLVTIAILSRLLTPADFGSVVIPLALVSLGQTLSEGAFGMNLIQRKSIDGTDVGAALLLSLGIGLLLAAATASAAPLVEWMVDIDNAAWLLLIAAPILTISAVSSVGRNLLIRDRRFSLIAALSTVGSVGYGVAATALALWGFGPSALILGALVRSFVQGAMVLTAALRRHRPRFSTARLREAFISARVYSLWSLFLWSGNNIDRLVVAKLSTVVDLGLYVRAMNVMQMALGLTGTGSFRVLFSTFSRMQDDLPRLRAAVQRALTAGLTISGLVAAFAVVFADLLVWIILGPQWVGAIPIIQVIFLSLTARSGYHFAEAVPASLGLARANAVRQALRTLLIGICAWIGAQYGIVGAAVGVAAAFWIFYVLILIYVARLISLPLSTALRINLIPLVVAAVPAGAALMVRQIPSGPQWLLDLAAVGLFALLALSFLARAPASIIGEDAVRLREKLLSIARKRGRGRKVSGT